MVSLASLWLPIVLGAVAVFFASSLIHMVFKWHNADYRKLSNEDEVRAAIRKGSATPGQYSVPHCLGPQDMAKPEIQQRFVEGPVAVMWVLPNGMPNMGKMLGCWFALNLLVSFMVAYIAAHTLAAGTAPMQVLRVTASIAFLAYAVGSVSDGIWMGKPWAAVAKDLLDALIYGFAGGAVFAFMWPGPAAG
ncbi:MAG: hypothetical protein ACT4PK_07940 [Gammaproteobacteria bacterium]